MKGLQKYLRKEKTLPKFVDNNQIKEILPTTINTSQLGIIMPLMRNIQNRNENSLLMDSVFGLEVKQ